MSTVSASSLGPGNFSSPGTPGGPAFSMTSTSWLSLQTFLHDVQNLPATLAALKTKMGAGAPDDMSTFQPLVDLYASMQTEASTFTGTIYPLIVSLASDIYDYNANIGVCYKALKQIVDAINTASNNGQTPSSVDQEHLKETFQYLAGKVTPLITKAGQVKSDLNEFITKMGTYSGTLTTLHGQYNTQYGTQSTAVANIQAEIASDTTALANYQAQYNHDVTVAATSPTYGWIWPVGTIAAAIVAGVYGHRATEALNSIHATTSEISGLKDTEKADSNLMSDLNMANNGISALKQHMTVALGIVEGVEGNWTAISADLSEIAGQLSSGASALPFLLEANYSQLISEWQTLATLCDNYRQNAFITVNS